MVMTSQRFTRILARPDQQPQITFDALYAMAGDLIGARLFTLTAVDHARQQATRIYTNMPQAYPCQGTKPVADNAWSRQVIQRREMFVANTIEAISQVFFDHELIRSLGCESVLNIPVTVAGRLVGTINCLDRAGRYTPERVQLARQLELPGVAAFLLENSQFVRGDH